MPGIDVVFHQAAIRITQCADEPRWHAKFSWMHVQRDRGGRARGRSKSRRRIVRLSLRAAEVFRRGESITVRQPHELRAAKLFNEGLLRQLQRDVRPAVRGAAVLQRYGPRMDRVRRHTECSSGGCRPIDSGRPPIIFGDGTQTMDFVHVATSRGRTCWPRRRR